MGGMHGFGPVIPEPREPVFHEDWERRTFALFLSMPGRRVPGEFRRVIERLPPIEYLYASYYERWLYTLEKLLIEKQILADGEIDARIQAGALTPVTVPAVANHSAVPEIPGVDGSPSRSVALRRDPRFKARFKPGDRVVARNLNPEGHTRLPRYVRGHRGVIRHDWGTFVFPDTIAHDAGANPQHCYAVEFTARELWGPSAPGRERVYVDLSEAYLQAEAIPATDARPAVMSPAKRKPALKATPPRAGSRRGKKAVSRATEIKPAAAARVKPKRASKPRNPKRVRRRPSVQIRKRR